MLLCNEWIIFYNGNYLYVTHRRLGRIRNFARILSERLSEWANEWGVCVLEWVFVDVFMYFTYEVKSDRKTSI